MNDKLPTLDPLIHQPARTQLVAYLASRGETTFTELKRVLGLTDGNLDAHLKKLIEAGYLTVRKEGKTGRPHTVYGLATLGRQALESYISQLASLLEVGTPEPFSFLTKPSLA